MTRKQKPTLFIAIFVLVAGLTGAILLVALPGSTAYAQSTDPCTAATGPETSKACNEAVAGGGDPCKAIRDVLIEDGKEDLADRKWKECRKIAICNTTNTGPNTLAACNDAIDNDDDPCDAMYQTLADDPRNDNTTLAEDTRAECAGVAGSSSNSNNPPLPEDKCDPSKNTCCGKVKTSIITGDFCDNGDGSSLDSSPIFGLLKIVLQIMTAGVGVAAVGGIAYGALLYSSAENKPEQTKKAIGIITNVVIGIAAYAMMYVLLNFLIPGGIFE